MSNVKSKKPTNKDVAEFAGVSVATVSYVMNGRTDKRIPEETRKKVLHAVNLLGYVPNPHATAIKTSVKDIVVRTSSTNSMLQNAETFAMLKELTSVFSQNGYTVNFSAETTPKRLTATACVCLGTENEEFYALANENFIPLVAVDVLLNDAVFYQVTTDYSTLKQTAEQTLGKDFTYVALRPTNVQLQNEICNELNTIFVDTITDVNNLPQGNLVVTDYVLAELLGERALNLCKVKTSKLDAVVKCVENAINRAVVDDNEHFLKI